MGKQGRTGNDVEQSLLYGYFHIFEIMVLTLKNLSKTEIKKNCPKASRFFFRGMLMTINGQYHIDRESLSPWVEWGQKVIRSKYNRNHDFTFR